MIKENKNVRNKYTLAEIVQLAYWLIRTKIINRKVRLFCFPITLRGKRFIDFGEGLTTGVGCRFDVFSNESGGGKIVIFGKNCQINDYVHIVGMNRIEIGNNVLMASHIFISDNSHGSYKGDAHDSNPTDPPTKRDYPTEPIYIGDNTWICESVMIMPGTKIGKGCVIGAHSIVRGEIPDYTIAAGNPAKVIKKYNFESQRWVKV